MAGVANAELRRAFKNDGSENNIREKGIKDEKNKKKVFRFVNRRCCRGRIFGRKKAVE